MLVSAADLVKVGVVEATLMVCLVLKVLLTVPEACEAGGVCTTTSPPRTGSPAQVRSYRVCSVPSLSLTTSLTTSFSLAPRPRVVAVCVVFSAALLISAVRWVGVSSASSALVRRGLGLGGAGFAAAGTVWTPTARSAAAATSAPAAVVLGESRPGVRGDLWGLLRLTRTPTATAAVRRPETDPGRRGCAARGELSSAHPS